MTSKQLKVWRERMHLKQVEAAKALGVAYSTYRQWEDGRIKPHKLLRLATLGYAYSSGVPLVPYAPYTADGQAQDRAGAS
jgi:DNA-binding XRE family transcriptional regulator